MQSDLTLRLPRRDEEEEFLRAHRATSPEVPYFLHYYKEGMPFSRYLEVLTEQERGVNLPPNHVPSTFLFAFVAKRIVGRVSIRHSLNPFLERVGGHIGYVVVPEFRRRGYATTILHLSIQIAREKLGIDRILVTCDDDNLGSIKTIEKNGGILENVISGPDLDKPKRRYWIEGSRVLAAQPPRLGTLEARVEVVYRFDLQPTLVGETISLRPLIADDFEALYAAASDPLIWEQHPEPLRYQRQVFKEFFAGALASGGALLVTDKTSGEVIGTSRYYEWNPDQREVAIGYTFLVRSHWGGATNREMKQLMLSHAFRWAKVVWFHVGKNNWRSRSAMEKVGGKLSHEASREHNGVVQDYVFFKIEAPQ